MSDQGPALAWCPFPDSESAESVVQSLLDEGLIACGNIIPAMRSIYVWEGNKSSSEETGVLLKTDRRLLEPLVRRLGELHPYAEPAILAWRCDSASAGTVSWLSGLVK